MNRHLARAAAATALVLGLSGSFAATAGAASSTSTGPSTATVRSTGTIVTVAPTANRVTVKIGRTSRTYVTSTSTAVSVGGKRAKLTTLRAKERVTVQGRHVGPLWLALQITA
jgi:cytoskeletal protein RodZ